MTQMTDLARVFARLAESGEREETATIGGIDIRAVRVAGGGTGRWDSHDHTPETVLVWSGDFLVTFRDRTVSLSAGQCCVVPVDTDHHGTSREGAEVVLFTAARDASA